MASCNHLGAKKQRAKFVCALREIFLVLIIFARDYSLNGHRLSLLNRLLTAGGTAASPMESQSHQRKNEKKERTLIFFWATGLCKLSTVIFGATQLNGSRLVGWLVGLGSRPLDLATTEMEADTEKERCTQHSAQSKGATPRRFGPKARAPLAAPHALGARRNSRSKCDGC